MATRCASTHFECLVLLALSINGTDSRMFVPFDPERDFLLSQEKLRLLQTSWKNDLGESSWSLESVGGVLNHSHDDAKSCWHERAECELHNSEPTPIGAGLLFTLYFALQASCMNLKLLRFSTSQQRQEREMRLQCCALARCLFAFATGSHTSTYLTCLPELPDR
jgi:hypothetical protein